MYDRKKVAVMIPCFNEEKAIAKTVKDFKKELPNSIVYVFDNNSTDKSVEKASGAGAEIVAVRQQGKGNVVREMFRQIDADIYIMVDGDDTYSACDAKKLINEISNGADMAIGDRLNSTYFKENKRFGHNFGNILVRKIINIFFKSNIQDVMTGYRAFSRRFVKTCPVLSSGFQVETEMTIQALDKKMSITSIPIQYKDRSGDNPSKLNTYTDGTKVMITIFNMIKECKPLLFFSCFATILLVIALGLGVPVLIEYFNTGLVVRFPSLIVATAAMILAFLCFLVGIILDVVVKKERQQFEIGLRLVCGK